MTHPTSLMPARIVRLNERIADFYVAAFSEGPLDATIRCMSSLIGGDLHLAFVTRNPGEVSFATSRGNEGRDFLMATMGAAASHPLIYQTDGEVTAISDVLSAREWRRRGMYHAARPFLKMEDSLGTDIRITPDLTFSTCVIRETRSFSDHERFDFQILLPHFRAVLRMGMETANPGRNFRLFPLESLPRSRRALHHFLREFLVASGCALLAARLADWIHLHRHVGSPEPQSITFRGKSSSCSAIFAPPGPRNGGSVAIRPHPSPPPPLPIPSLTARESEVGHWLCSGKTNAEIALILGIAPGTAKRHLENIYEKLGVPNRAGAIRAILLGSSLTGA